MWWPTTPMAWKLRVEYSGACYHVINRGNYRSDLFACRGAAASFQQCLFEACTRFRWRLHAFVIMRNHFHLAVETPEPNLSLGMKWLQKLAASIAIDLTGLPAQKSAPEKLQLASALKQLTSVSNRWLAQRLQMGAPTGVSSFLHRFQASGGTRTRSFRAAVEPFAS